MIRASHSVTVFFMMLVSIPMSQALRWFGMPPVAHRVKYPSSPEKDCALLQLRGGEIQHPASMEELDAILAEASEKLIVIDFYSNDCKPCEQVAPLYVELSESEEFDEKVVFVKINVQDQPEITAKYQVTGWPTFLFIKNSKVLTEIVGGKLAEATLYDWVKLLMPKEEKNN